MRTLGPKQNSIRVLDTASEDVSSDNDFSRSVRDLLIGATDLFTSNQIFTVSEEISIDNELIALKALGQKKHQHSFADCNSRSPELGIQPRAGGDSQRSRSENLAAVRHEDNLEKQKYEKQKARVANFLEEIKTLCKSPTKPRKCSATQLDIVSPITLDGDIQSPLSALSESPESPPRLQFMFDVHPPFHQLPFDDSHSTHSHEEDKIGTGPIGPASEFPNKTSSCGNINSFTHFALAESTRFSSLQPMNRDVAPKLPCRRGVST